MSYASNTAPIIGTLNVYLEGKFIRRKEKSEFSWLFLEPSTFSGLMVLPNCPIRIGTNSADFLLALPMRKLKRSMT